MAQDTNQQAQPSQNGGSSPSAQEGTSGRQQTSGGEAARTQGTSMARQTGGTQISRPSTQTISSPFSMMRRMMEDMDRMFDDFGLGSIMSPFSMTTSGMPFGGMGMSRRLPQVWSPQIEVAQEQGQMVIRADVPGMTMENIRVELEGDALTISGERSGEQKEQRGNVSYSERSYGSFARTIPLPTGVDADQVEASFSNGVLEVRVKVPETQTQGRRIQIRSGEGK